MKRVVLLAALPLLMALGAAPASAADQDRQFFDKAGGDWSGPGEIIAGKYKGTKFVCNFTGSSPASMVGLTLDGGCRVGPFLQKMTGRIEKRGENYKGTFLDGADGKGLDVLSGNVVGPDKVILTINRKQLNGTMQARIADKDTMTVTVSVQVEDSLIPVIGMNLKRVDATAVGSIAK